ncbi:hypothetical protein QQS21_003262 [Conoideocrella luteorostrata]|uniref:Beta-lactamase-related domain-containing protein n=1 Tax=Conoideocrella luteorostrata TaxID=1105319 RepID=A0AAJ0CTQ5_9HYPO|nr:hypothetical protein QQS21_003262 [Conoideocrella luteorostrata]
MAGEIEASFQAAIESGKINGAVLCASDAKGNFVYNRAFGERTLLSGEKKPQQLDDVLYLASATKLIATIAALQCVEDGLLTLTGDLSAIVPELAAKQVLKGFSDDADESPVLEPAARPITLEMLMTHSAGTAYDFLVPPIGKWREKYSPPQPDQRKTVEELFVYPLYHQPGAGWMYGPGLDWAGRAVERVTGRTLGEHVLDRILAPLGLNDAQFFPVTREDLRQRLVDLNPADPEAAGRAVLGGGGDMNKRGKGDFGGQGLFMSGASYCQVLRSLLANDGKILKPATVESMFQDHLAPESIAGFQAAMSSSAGVFFRVGVDQETKMGYGLGGLLTLEDTDGWYGSHTLSWGGGMTLAWFIDRKNDLCAVGAIQSALPQDGQLVTELKQVFRKDIYRKKAAWQASDRS